MNSFSIAVAYFLKSKSERVFRLIPKAAMLGLALSLTVLLTTLSVMNGFERDIRLKLLSRTPHIIALTGKHLDLGQLHFRQQEHFYQTKMLLPQYGYLQVNTIFTDKAKEIAVSSQLEKMIYGLGESVDLMCFLGKTTFGQKVPSVVSVVPSEIIDDHQLNLYLPLAKKADFPGLQLQPMIGFWLDDPLQASSMTEKLSSLNKEVAFISWEETFSSLFDALRSEKRLVSIVLSLLIVLIYVQMSLTLLLVFKDKEKDMIALYFFLGGKKSLYRTFFSYGLLNILTGILLGALGGWLMSLYIPDIVLYLEQTFHFHLLPYEQYYFNHLPSEFALKDMIYVVVCTLVAGLVSCHCLVQQIKNRSIEKLLRQYQ